MLQKLIFLTALSLSTIYQVSYSQAFFAGIQVGASHYQGDLLNDISAIRTAKPCFGVFGQYYPWKHLSVQLGLNAGKISGADRYNIDAGLVARNLSFESRIYEIYGIGQIDLFHFERISLVPYVFAGFSYFRYNPYSYDRQGNKVYLQPLHTEAQGSAAYPDRKIYSLENFAFPLGVGIKYHINSNYFIGIEMGLRKTNTDYLDDVSSSYATEEVLLEYAGPKAVEMAFRGDELNSKAHYPNGNTRGNPDQNDWYYITQLKIGIKPTFFFSSKQNKYAKRYNKRIFKNGKVKCPKF